MLKIVARVYLGLYKDITTLLWFRVIIYIIKYVARVIIYKVFEKMLQHYDGSAYYIHHYIIGSAYIIIL